MLAAVFFVPFAIHEFGDDFSFVSGWVVTVGVELCFSLGSLLARSAAVHGLVLVKVVVLVLVKVALGHVGLNVERECGVYGKNRSAAANSSSIVDCFKAGL